jgi:lysozyme family protein
MKNYEFKDVCGEISRNIDSAIINKNPSISMSARCLLRAKPRYEHVSKLTGAPVAWLMAIHNRESGGNFSTYLGNGEPLSRVTRLEPPGRGPFSHWEDGALDALSLRGWDKIKDWTWERACYEAERWNGFGYRAYHGVPSPYVWGSTSVQVPGKYVSDGHWDSSVTDRQAGTFALMKAIIELDPTLELPRLQSVAPQKTQEVKAMANVPVLPVQSAGVTTSPIAALITNVITALSFGLSVAGFSMGSHVVMAAAPLAVTFGGLALSHLSVSGPNQNTIALVNNLLTALVPQPPEANSHS